MVKTNTLFMNKTAGKNHIPFGAARTYTEPT